VPNIRWLLALITVLHRLLYRASGGRLGARLGRLRFLLLVHSGRRSGRARVTPLLYVEDGGRFAVVASNAGDDRPPAWWLNLQAHPDARIQAGRQQLAVTARRASPEESRQLWPKLLDAYRWYADYRQRTRREIPIVLLEPTP
jgi:F420H(2)-dependent quinone reductase